MKHRDETDRKLRELFTAARSADRAEAPDFRAVLDGRPRGSRPQVRGRSIGVAALASIGSLAVAALAGWIYVQQTGPAPAAPTASRQGAPGESKPQTPDAPGLNVVRPAVTPPAPPVSRTVATMSSPVEPMATAAPVTQPERTGLAVRVSDQSGPLAGATVTLSDARRVPAVSLVTDVKGQATFTALAAEDDYAVEVSFPGFGTQRLDGIDLEAGENRLIVIKLAETYTERAVVTAQRAQTQLPRTSTATHEYIGDLAVSGEFYQKVLTLSPGVAADSSDATARGSSARDFRAIVDGVSNVDPLAGRFTAKVSANSIEEMEVISSGAGPEFGRAQGGFANIESGSPAEAEYDTESYDTIRENDFLSVLDNPLSTFSIDVDTASYANVRRFLTSRRRPPRNAVRIEELVNYFRYDYLPPAGDAPFSSSVEIADSPWNGDHRLVRIGLMGREIPRGQLGGSNLVFLIDVSGSMQPPNKLPLLKSAFALLVEQLGGSDQVAIVVYAGASGVVLPPTPGSAKAEILAALERLQAGGSTNGGSGLRLAYKLARENFVEGGINRVVLATDGDFNVGVTDRGTLLELIEQDARDGIFLTALGFGMGNYKDDTLELLADRGNGNYAYIDNLREARKVLVEEIGGTLVTIAKDVKIQVEFNPAEVGAYRLIGYENRMLRKEDFNDDRKDAGEIGAGHRVTALYEIVPPGMHSSATAVDPLKYQTPPVIADKAAGGEVLTLKIRYKEPDGRKSRLLEFPVIDPGLTLDQASADFKFAAAVAGFGMILRDSPHRGSLTLDEVRGLALAGAGPDTFGYRAELIELIGRAARLID